MAWFWQKKKEETDKKTAEQLAAVKKQGVAARVARAGKEAGKQATGKKESGKATGKEKKATKRAPIKAGAGFGVLLGPVVTEKAARLAEEGIYIFAVTEHANKIAIAAAVKAVYGVHPTKVAVLNTKGKPKVYAQRYGRRASARKAYVTLTKGETLELFEGTEK